MALLPAVTICLALTFLNPHVYLDTVILLGALANQHGDQTAAVRRRSPSWPAHVVLPACVRSPRATPSLRPPARLARSRRKHRHRDVDNHAFGFHFKRHEDLTCSHLLIDTPELHPEKSSPMTHRRAVALILVTLMWSIALASSPATSTRRAASEVNFWRSLFNAIRPAHRPAGHARPDVLAQPRPGPLASRAVAPLTSATRRSDASDGSTSG